MKVKFQLLGLLALATLMFFTKCQPPDQSEAEAAQADTITQLVNHVVTMWNTMNPDMISECYASSFQRTTPTGSQTNEAELRDLMNQTAAAYTGFNVNLEELVIKDDQAFGKFTISGTNTGPLGENMPATGKSFSTEGIVSIRVQDGKIVEDEAYWNHLNVLTQLGYSLQAPIMEGEMEGETME